MALRDRLVDPQSPDRRPRRAAYALPTLFTAGNIFLGYLSILRSFRGAMEAAAGTPGAMEHFKVAAIAIGVAVFTDGLDGSIARLTHTTSDFGREMDSLADVISFGLAPAVLAIAWGVQFVEPALSQNIRGPIFNAAYFIAFLFLLCGAARLARFNIQKNPIPKNPGRPDRKYFVGLPIPGAAGLIAAVVFAADGEPIVWPPLAIAWLGLLLLLGFLMVSTWRYYSLKGISLNKAYSTLILVLVGGLIYAIWNYGRTVLLVLAVVYVGSGIVIRIGGMIRRRLRPAPRHPSYPMDPERQVG
ncbi:MAG: CDP-diacylglycerol--serine O-phosphatidyltransferase [Acidobacteriia bacterium]|nr:CDP-diacylglycerol--serine O-phosphatidyltransferase [Terriglobia bacterium]MBV8905592.1 CDP-diacylglycerol--serine O-phosphatidyltransferase [Terriglobia bacterium]MBV9746607.1 CDP-diacylglycerol--serine O-phosphatidyltransferase [Terriglobia bacterium]